MCHSRFPHDHGPRLIESRVLRRIRGERPE
jgi:hypothetical protein